MNLAVLALGTALILAREGAAQHPTSAASYLGGSDDCQTATYVFGPAAIPFDNGTATTGSEGQDSPACVTQGAGPGITHDLWFLWEPGLTGRAKIDTCDPITLNSKIAVYAGPPGCPVGDALVCDDNSCGGGSVMEFDVELGRLYTLQVGSRPGSVPGAGVLNLDAGPVPPNDACAAPEFLLAPGVHAFPDLTWATTGAEGQDDTGCSFTGSTRIEHDIWYAFTPDCTGSATLTTCGLTVADTKIAVWEGYGCPGPTTPLLDCSDDDCASFQTTVSWDITYGMTYTIQLGTFPDNGGSSVVYGAGELELTLASCQPESPPGIAGCSGDGTGSPCPCGNEADPGQGCANSTGAGARLDGFGRTDPDTVVLRALGLLPGQAGLFFQGELDLSPGFSFGDGLRCCGEGVIRLSVVVADEAGCAASDASCGTPVGGFPGPISAHPAQPVSLPGSGLARCYQLWYRDPIGGPCGSGFNLTDNYTIGW